MLEAYVRPIFQYYLVNPFAKRVSQRFSHNAITLFACLTGVAVAPALFFGFTGTAVILLLISGYFDTLDGTVARLSGKVSPRGAVLDIVSDRVVEFAILLGLFSVDPTHRGLWVLLIFGSCYICVATFLVVALFTPNESDKSFHYNDGLMERAEAFVFFLFMIWMPGQFALLSVGFVGLALWTSYRRIRQFLQNNPAS